MPTLSLRIIKSPRKKRKCDNCYKPITGETIRLYGMAEIGDKPYQVFLHRDCVSGRKESAMLRAAELGEVANGSFGSLINRKVSMDKPIATDIGNMQSAILREDGSLIIMGRKSLGSFTENDWEVLVSIWPNGVKNLKALLDRAAELPLEPSAQQKAACKCGWVTIDKIHLVNVDCPIHGTPLSNR